MIKRREKGSITLFTLIAMMFLLTIAFTAYTSAMIKLQAQNEDLERIKASYEQDLTEEGLASLYEKLTRPKWKIITFDVNDTYGIIKNNTLKLYADTGEKLNWDNNFKIETTVRISELNKRYLIIGSFDSVSNKELNIEISAENKLRVFIGTGQVDKSDGIIYENEDINIIFEWNAVSNTYNIKAKGNKTDIEFDGNYEVKGYSNNELRIGKRDFRGYSVFETITVNELKVYYESSIDVNYQKKVASEIYYVYDTGYKINWDNNFKIETTVKISELNKRYLIIGSYDGISEKELNIEFNEQNKLRVFIGTGQVNKSEGTIYENEDINIIFEWNAMSKTYNIKAKGDKTDIEYNGRYEMNGNSENNLRIGSLDYRGYPVFYNIQIINLFIDETRIY
ncbi:MAG: hypothetical protein IKF83_04205 [Clostridia bacterium]|nr:hypothetical protein [Clostridia bacterium]